MYVPTLGTVGSLGDSQAGLFLAYLHHGGVRGAPAKWVGTYSTSHLQGLYLNLQLKYWQYQHCPVCY